VLNYLFKSTHSVIPAVIFIMYVQFNVKSYLINF